MGANVESLFVHVISKVRVGHIALMDIMTDHAGITPAPEILNRHWIDLLLLNEIGFDLFKFWIREHRFDRKRINETLKSYSIDGEWWITL